MPIARIDAHVVCRLQLAVLVPVEEHEVAGTQVGPLTLPSCPASTGSGDYPWAHFKITQAVPSTDHGQRTLCERKADALCKLGEARSRAVPSTVANLLRIGEQWVVITLPRRSEKKSSQEDLPRGG